jgi:hypothetical protein
VIYIILLSYFFALYSHLYWYFRLHLFKHYFYPSFDIHRCSRKVALKAHKGRIFMLNVKLTVSI